MFHQIYMLICFAMRENCLLATGHSDSENQVYDFCKFFFFNKVAENSDCCSVLTCDVCMVLSCMIFFPFRFSVAQRPKGLLVETHSNVFHTYKQPWCL